MKHFIWMLCGIFLSGLLLGSLSACGADQFSTTVITTGQPSQEAGQADEPEAGVMPEDAVEPGEPAVPETVPANPVEEEIEIPAVPMEEDTARRLAYGAALWDAYLKGVLPDGAIKDWRSPEDAAENQFAICDLDGDGEEELLLRWTAASMAGTVDYVLRYDSQGVHPEFQEFAGVEFYDNGAAVAGWSHNQGWAGRFWPFNLYRYDGSAGTYQEVGAVDAWDRALFEDDEALSAAFPADVDADGDGLVYYILTGEWYNNSRTPSDGNLDGRLWGVEPVDGPDMENWLNRCIDGAELVQLPLQKLTEENIAALGAPRPDVEYPEPLG